MKNIFILSLLISVSTSAVAEQTVYENPKYKEWLANGGMEKISRPGGDDGEEPGPDYIDLSEGQKDKPIGREGFTDISDNAVDMNAAVSNGQMDENVQYERQVVQATAPKAEVKSQGYIPAYAQTVVSTTPINGNPAAKVEQNLQVEQSAKNFLAQKKELKRECREDNSLCISIYEYPTHMELLAQNMTNAARTFTLKYVTLDNVRTESEKEQIITILKANETKVIDRFMPLDYKTPINFNYEFNSYYGIVDAMHNDDFEYELPYGYDQEPILVQGVGGKFSHTTIDGQYAYDFKLAVGTPVYAARGGTVVETSDGFINGGVSKSLIGKSNRVRIQHDDGTIASYSHLKLNGVLVRVGDTIQTGQKIGLSGNTGYSNIPHLHFGVNKLMKDWQYHSIPVKMKTTEGVFNELKPGQRYTRKNKTKTFEIKSITGTVTLGGSPKEKPAANVKQLRNDKKK